MKEMNDEELQQLAGESAFLNQNLALKDQQDVAAYQTLFKKLQAEPTAGLPLNFAANVRRAVQRRTEQKADMKFQLMLFFIFTVILATAFGLLHLINPVAGTQLLSISPKFKWSAGLGILVFWTIQFGSHRLNKDDSY